MGETRKFAGTFLNTTYFIKDYRDHLAYPVQRAAFHELHVYRHVFRKSERQKA